MVTRSKEVKTWVTRHVDDWSIYGYCFEDVCQAGPGEPCWSNPPDRSKRTGGRRRRKTAHPTRPKKSEIYPEHEKLAAISDQSQTIYDFLSWLDGEKGVVLGNDNFGYAEGKSYVPDGSQVKGWLAEFFEIDLDKIEAEKRAMLDELARESQDMGTT